MMLKSEKVEYVKKMQEEVKKYSTVGIMSLESVPDSLVQKARNGLKPEVKFIVARKSLAHRIMDADPRLARLKDYATGNFAILLSNKEPSELNALIVSNKMKLIAKPNQIAPSEISIEAGETSIAPGQAVTDMKTAGIDVKIDKGKVVISKSKVLVKKGDKISTAISKALKMLDIMPFEAGTKLKAVVNGNLLFNEAALGIDVNFVTQQIASSFAQADALSTSIGLVTQYNADAFIRKAYLSALGLGLGAQIYEPGITDKLIARAVREALSLNPMVKAEPKQEEAKPADGESGQKPAA
jgi:large subunit ribosomal protein L10